jgi:Ferredoxin-dependent bilin reductase
VISCSASFLPHRSLRNVARCSHGEISVNGPTCTAKETLSCRAPYYGSMTCPGEGEATGGNYQDRTVSVTSKTSSHPLRACGMYRSIGESVWQKLVATGWLEPCRTIPDALLSNEAPTKGMKGWITRIETRALSAIDTKDQNSRRQPTRLNPISYARLALIETIPSPDHDDAESARGDARSRKGSSPSVHTKGIQVLNVVILPRQTSTLPIWGADFVSLPSDKHLLLLDAQPVDAGVRVGRISEFDAYWREWYQRYDIASRFPWGGDLPDPVKPFVSSNALWTRFSSSMDDSEGLRRVNPVDSIKDHLQPVVESHLDIYLTRLADFSWANSNRNLQSDYIRYRRENDPARPMLKALYGEEWTESLLSKVMFPHNF